MQPILIECPRDAMQGWKNFIPTPTKIAYLNSLLKVGFDTLDFGSFVSAKAIPQMADTKEVLKGLHTEDTSTKLLSIIANERGAEEAVAYHEISYLGFPFSVSPTFQQRNTNSTQDESMHRIEAIQNLCVKNNKQLVVYLSMGFGNPYGDIYNEDVLMLWAERMVQQGISIISLADTVGTANAQQISSALKTLIPEYTNIQFGVHLHSTIESREEKLNAAIEAGCSRFDGALKGIGGCPMAQDELVGNMDTEFILSILEKQYPLHINKQALKTSVIMADEVFV